MKFNIKSKEFFHKELTFVKRITDGATLVVGMSAKDNKVSLYVTNYNEELSTVMDAEVIEEGDFVYFDYFVVENVETLPEGMLTVTTSSNKVVFSVGKHKRNAALYGSFVPPLLEYDGEWGKIDKKFLQNVVHAAKMCTNREEKHFSCVNIHKESGWIIGGDREKLMVIEGLESPFSKTVNIKEKPILNYFPTMKGGKEDDVEISLQDKTLAIRTIKPEATRRLLVSLPKVRYDQNVYNIFDKIQHKNFTKVTLTKDELNRIVDATHVYGKKMKKTKDLAAATFKMGKDEISVEMIADLTFRLDDFLIAEKLEDKSTLRAITIDVSALKTAIAGMNNEFFYVYFSDSFVVVDTENFHFLQTARRRKAIEQ